MKKVPLPKISLLVQLKGRQVQIPLKLAWIETFTIQAYLEGFIWSNWSVIMLITYISMKYQNFSVSKI